MRKALLADDDYLVRTYLKTLSAWEKAGFEIVADVRDGEEALEVLKKNTVELVVTDMAMPLMDGIELIRRIREKYPHCYVIVLSCHDEFEYVKEAMKEGADEYVLKNALDEESLYTQLVSAAEALEKREHSKAFEAEEPKVEAAGRRNGKFFFFNQILAGTLSEEDREQERIKAGVRGRYQNSAVIVIRVDEKPDEEADPLEEMKREQHYLELLHKFCEKLEETAAEIQIKKDMIYIGNGTFCCFVDLTDLYKGSVMYQKLTTMASACYKICREEAGGFQIGVSNICIGADALRMGYQQARTMMKNSFYDRDGIAYYDPDRKMGEELPEKAVLLLQQEEELRRKKDKDRFLTLAQEAVQAFREELTDGELVIQWLNQLGQPVIRQTGKNLSSVSYMDEVLPVIHTIADRLFAGRQEELPEKLSRPVQLAAEFALEHYRGSVGLSDAAAAAGVNATYLSYLFRQEMGTGFSNYLLKLRLEYAKQLLGESGLKMWQVAEQAGFHDYHYFSKVFKKTIGQTPAQYKNNTKK